MFIPSILCVTSIIATMTSAYSQAPTNLPSISISIELSSVHTNYFFRILNKMCKQLRKMHGSRLVSNHLPPVNGHFGKPEVSLLGSGVI